VLYDEDAFVVSLVQVATSLPMSNTIHPSWTVIQLDLYDAKENRNPVNPCIKRDHIMLKFFVGSLLIVFAAQSAQAQITVDISKITCEQFNVLEKQDSVAIWLSGFYHGQKRDPVLEINVFEETVRKYRAACRQADNFKRRVMELYESSQPK